MITIKEKQLQEMETIIERLDSTTTTDNLSPNEHQVLKRLRRREDIIIKPAEKGAGVVVMKKQDYLFEAYRQLNNSEYYEKLTENPTDCFANEVKSTVTKMFQKGSIDQKVLNFLVPSNPRTALLYLLPKIHEPGNPGRPIVSSCGTATENISRYVDYFLQHLAAQVPSYIKNTTSFLNKIQDLPRLPPGYLLVTLDVTSLCTNIPHDEGISACMNALNTRPSQHPPTSDICQLIELILTRNNFIFNEENYLQLQGTAMGTRMAPSYTVMFMDHLEQQFLSTQPLQQ